MKKSLIFFVKKSTVATVAAGNLSMFSGLVNASDSYAYFVKNNLCKIFAEGITIEDEQCWKCYWIRDTKDCHGDEGVCGWDGDLEVKVECGPDEAFGGIPGLETPPKIAICKELAGGVLTPRDFIA